MDETRWMTLLTRQKEQEEAMRSQGAARFKRRLEAAVRQGEATQAGAAKKLLQEALLPTEQEIGRRLSAVLAGRKHMAAKWVPLAGAEVCAYLTAMTVLDHTDRIDAHTAAREIGQMVIDDIRATQLQRQAPFLFKYRMARYKSERYDRKVEAMEWTIKQAEGSEEVDLSEFYLTASQKVQLGTWLLDCFLQATGLVTRHSATKLQGRKMRREAYLQLTDEAKEWCKQRNENLLFRFPVILPMLIQPLEWKPGQRGGYRFGQRASHSLVKKVRGEQAAAIKTADMPRVYQAVNAMQATAWRVNKNVLEDVEYSIGFEPEPLPPKPENIDEDFTARKAWKHAAHQVHDRNREEKRKALDRMRIIRMAMDLRNEERFYFPHNLDWRGRVYPLASALQPQGDDLCRGLLEFHEGKPLGENGAGWLAVHLANKLGQTPQGQKVSTMTFEERCEWVMNNQQMFRYDDLWRTAEEPYAFRAATHEWLALLQHLRLGNTAESFVSHLPISLDGTANGLQHFSALLRDDIGGRAVNLVPQSRPQDIYLRVADAIAERCGNDASENSLAALWLSSGLVTRRLTKRCVMTFSYGSREYGFNEQLSAYLKGEDWKAIRQHFLSDAGENRVPAACRYMAHAIWEALQGTVVAAFYGMEWLQKCARLIVDEHGKVEWTVPGTNFPVIQRYLSLRRRQVDTWLAGKVFKPSIMIETEKQDGIKAVNGISPNYIHSLDAAALMLTVCRAHDEGIRSFAMVHDSFGTHAGEVERLAVFTREEFVNLYELYYPLAKIREDFLRQMPAGKTIPREPDMGSLDLDDVLVSRYFFG